MTNFRLLLLQRAGLFSSLVPDCTAVRVCFDFAAWPHYTTPSLFSSFSINEAETFKKQMPDASGGNSPKCSKVWNFLSVVTIISRIKWSCCLDTRFGKATIACNLICYPRWIAWISDRHLSKLKKKNGHFGHKIFIGKLLNYRSNRYLYVLPEVWIVMIWLIKKVLVLTLAYMKQKIHGLVASKGAGHFPKEHYVCVTTARLHLPWHAIM